MNTQYTIPQYLDLIYQSLKTIEDIKEELKEIDNKLENRKKNDAQDKSLVKKGKTAGQN